MLMSKDRLSVDVGCQEFIRLVSSSNRYIFKGISPEIAELSTQLLADTSNDPADRVISATAIVEKSQARHVRQSPEAIKTDYNHLVG